MGSYARTALLLAMFGAAAALFIPTAHAGKPENTKRVFKVRGNVTEIATSGRRVAFVQQLKRGSCDRVVVWEPSIKKATRMPKTSGCGGGAPTGEGIFSVAMANRQVAWIDYSGGNFRGLEVSTVRLGTASPKVDSFGLREYEVDSGWSGNGEFIGNLHAAGSGTNPSDSRVPVIAWNTWSGCYFDPGLIGNECTPPDGLIPASAETVVWNERMARWRPGGQKTVFAGSDALWVSGAAKAKVALQGGPIPPGGPDPRPPKPSPEAPVRMFTPGGSALGGFTVPAGTYFGTVLNGNGSRYLAIRDSSLDVYNPITGELVTSIPVNPPTNLEKQRFELTSALNGVATYVSGKRVYVVRHSDGASFFIKPKRAYRAVGERSAVDAELTPKALVFSHNVGPPKKGAKPGRVVWLPIKTINERLDAS